MFLVPKQAVRPRKTRVTPDCVACFGHTKGYWASFRLEPHFSFADGASAGSQGLKSR